MDIYRLSNIGYRLSHNFRHENSPKWAAIHYLARNHFADKEKILREVPGLTSGMITELRTKGVIVNETGIEVEQYGNY